MAEAYGLALTMLVHAKVADLCKHQQHITVNELAQNLFAATHDIRLVRNQKKRIRTALAALERGNLVHITRQPDPRLKVIQLLIAPAQ